MTVTRQLLPFPLFLFAFLPWSPHGAKAENYEDGPINIERITAPLPKENISLILPTPAETGGVAMMVNYNPGTPTPKRGVYFWSETSGSTMLCDDFSKEFASIGHHLNPSATALRGGVYVTTYDSTRTLSPIITWRCGYDGKIERIIGRDDVITYASPLGQKKATIWMMNIPFPSEEDGIYYFIGWFFEYPISKSLASSMVRFEKATNTATEVFKVSANDMPNSLYNSAFWTNGTVAVFTTERSGILRYNNLGERSVLVSPNFVLGSGRILEGIPGFTLTRDTGIDTSYRTNGVTSLLFCDDTGCLPYFTDANLNGMGLSLMMTPYTISHADPCTTALANNGNNLLTVTAALACDGEETRLFIQNGIFLDGTTARYHIANGLEGRSAYIFRARPGQESGKEIEWELWKATIAPPKPPPMINYFTISESIITTGRTVTLSWDVTNAKTVTISDIGSVETSGSREVVPERSKTYTLSASSTGGVVEATVDVQVRSSPIVPPRSRRR